MSKTTLKPRILIVNDDPRFARELKRVLVERFNCTVCAPSTAEVLKQAVLYEAFDSVFVEADRLWPSDKLRIFDKPIIDGIDFARVYCKYRKKTLIVVFGPNSLSSERDAAARIRRVPCNIRTIGRPLPLGREPIRKALELLHPQVSATATIHKENPIFQPTSLFRNMPRLERELSLRLLYKQARQQTEEWVNFNLHKEVEDSSWTILCGGNLQKRFYGELLNGGSPPPDITINPRYPSRSQFDALANSEGTPPLLFWNTQNASLLSKQFEDNRLKKIPADLHRSFGIDVGPDCAKAYNEGDEKHVVRWCQKVSRPSRLETVKTIFMNLNGDRERSIRGFTERCKRADITRVVDIFRARIDKVDESQNCANIELTNIMSTKEKFAAPFDLTYLRARGLKEVDQSFQYTVYADAENSFGEIDLIASPNT